MIRGVTAVLITGVVAGPALSWGQVTPPGAPAPAAPQVALGPAVGSVAPDFTLPGATRYGLLRAPIRLSDYRGQTVVLAFFFQARTKG
ncbi:MAG TPA: hypothetical protein VES88_08435 [Gemmatimonadaceae bacterium]|nr:hypothetical protein [Gemmatimonadaceae bacterium]